MGQKEKQDFSELNGKRRRKDEHLYNSFMQSLNVVHPFIQ